MTKTLGEYWITFDVLEAEAKRLEDATGASEHDRVGGVVTQEPSDGTAMVVFEVVALDQDGAWRQAEEAYQRLREDARLDVVPPLGGSVTRLREAPMGAIGTPEAESSKARVATPTPQAHERLLEKAHDFLDRGEYEHASVAAQTACEVAIGDAMRRLIARDFPVLQKAMEGFIHRQFSLSQARMADLWQALAGEDMRQAPGELWSRFDSHRKRQNGVVHEARAVSHEEAEHDVRVAREVCEYVTRLSR